MNNISKNKREENSMNYIIVDLEATCEKNKKDFVNEVIEIGAVKIIGKESPMIVDTFCSFVKPIVNPVLTNFCKELTTITQDDVDNANKFPVVIEDFKKWAGVGEEDYLICSWGFYDKKQFIQDCKLHGLDKKWIEKRHISLKHQHSEILGSRPMGMAKALRKAGIKLEGTHHRGIDDARNISKIFINYFEQWKLK